MRTCLDFYIDGQWGAASTSATIDVFNPANELLCGRIAAGAEADIDRAVLAARKAFVGWSLSSRAERLDLLQAIIAEYQKRMADLADAVTEEMGAPASLAARAQVPVVLSHFGNAVDTLKDYPFEEQRGKTLIRREPIGVCGFITPWNWPLNQIACKVAPALATGCTMVLKPSEVAPFSGHIFAEVMHAAGVPAGVFNLVHGDGPTAGAALSSHPEVDMVSFTGSTRAGIEVARNAAPTCKRVAQELGGKSPNIILDDEIFAQSVGRSVGQMMVNSGQSCNAPTRMLVPAARMGEAMAVAKAAAEQLTIGDPKGNHFMGPVVSKVQWDKIQGLIQQGIDEGATLVTGGPGRPDGIDEGYFVKPTVFGNVTNDMTIAREEIFGPVLSILAYDTIDQAVATANDTPYGLAGYVNGADVDAASAIAKRIRAGQISINGAHDSKAPFGGFKMSGNGREWGDFGFDDFIEIQAVLGTEAA